MRRWITGLLAFLFVAVGAATAQVPPGLRAGDTVLFLGDSITHQCLYTRYVTLFYMTRYPGTPLHFYNSGVGGDRAVNALKRFDYDVAELKPACVTVLLGMNDGGYRPLGEPQLSTYKRDMTKLVDRLRKETKARLFLLTPSMYDYKTREMHGRGGCPVYNQALIAFGDFLKELGKKQGLPVVDMNKPLVEATNALRRNDPKATLIPGGVHPNAAGHMVMAYTILKAFGVTPVVSEVTINVKGRQIKAQRAAASNLQVRGGQVRFDVREAALPFPYRPDARAVLRVLPFAREMNREVLKIEGLAPGKYQLEIDGAAVGQFTAAQLSKGVNLSGNEKTPQYRQAAAVMKLNDQRTDVMRSIRGFRLMEKRRGYPKPDGTYPRPPLKIVRTPDGKRKWVPAPELVTAFETQRKNLPNLLQQVRDLEAKCYKAAQPTAHHYRLNRLGSL